MASSPWLHICTVRFITQWHVCVLYVELKLFDTNRKVGTSTVKDPSGCLEMLLTWCWRLLGCVCVCLILFLYSFLIHSRKVQVTGQEFQCHPADIFPGRHHRAIPHRPVASGLPWTLPLLYERQSHTGTYHSENTLSWLWAWIAVSHIILFIISCWGLSPTIFSHCKLVLSNILLQ